MLVIPDPGILAAVIQSFRDRDTQAFFNGEPVRRFQAFRDQARRKLDALDEAPRVEDLREPPGNRLERLAGGRRGQWSIRVNQQYRICFVWDEGDAGPSLVEITDYH